MDYPKAYIEFIAHFNGTKDFFECHEVLEEYWKEQTPGKRNSVWVWLIQLAVSIYHYRRGNIKGARKLLNRLQFSWHEREDELKTLGLDVEGLETILIQLDRALSEDKEYTAINLPIRDADLELLVKQTCTRWQIPYERPDDLDDYFLIHKHKLRHRQ